MRWPVKIALGSAGKNFRDANPTCVLLVRVVCSDLRLGAQAQTVAMNFEKVCGHIHCFFLFKAFNDDIVPFLRAGFSSL